MGLSAIRLAAFPFLSSLATLRVRRSSTEVFWPCGPGSSAGARAVCLFSSRAAGEPIGPKPVGGRIERKA